MFRQGINAYIRMSIYKSKIISLNYLNQFSHNSIKISSRTFEKFLEHDCLKEIKRKEQTDADLFSYKFYCISTEGRKIIREQYKCDLRRKRTKFTLTQWIKLSPLEREYHSRI